VSFWPDNLFFDSAFYKWACLPICLFIRLALIKFLCNKKSAWTNRIVVRISLQEIFTFLVIAIISIGAFYALAFALIAARNEFWEISVDYKISPNTLPIPFVWIITALPFFLLSIAARKFYKGKFEIKDILRPNALDDVNVLCAMLFPFIFFAPELFLELTHRSRLVCFLSDNPACRTQNYALSRFAIVLFVLAFCIASYRYLRTNAPTTN